MPPGAAAGFKADVDYDEAEIAVRGGGSASGQSDTAVSPTAVQPRKKQKRNKPTLSCSECVDRKTKARATASLYLSLSLSFSGTCLSLPCL